MIKLENQGREWIRVNSFLGGWGAESYLGISLHSLELPNLGHQLLQQLSILVLMAWIPPQKVV